MGGSDDFAGQFGGWHLHLGEGEPAAAKVFERGSEVVDGVVDAEETVVRLVEHVDGDRGKLGVMLPDVKRKLLGDGFGVDLRGYVFVAFVKEGKHGIINVVVNQNYTLLGGADKVGGEGVGLEDLAVEEDTLLGLDTCVKATEHLVKPLVGLNLAVFDAGETLEEVLVCGEELASGGKRPHDTDVDFDGSGSAQYAAEHGHAILGERIGEIFDVAAATRVQGRKLRP